MSTFMDGSLLLVHSPLVGPSSWGPLAEAAIQRGIDVVRPDLTGIAEVVPPKWPYFVAGAVDAAHALSDTIVVGHSGAGTVLPVIGEQLGDRLSALVFVDAVVPPLGGVYRTPAGMVGLLDEKTTDGILLKWLDWWPAEDAEELLPRPEDRTAVAADMPRLPRSFYEEEVSVPQSWSEAMRCGYLKLSDAYDEEFAEAQARRWPRHELEGTHFSIYTDAETVLNGLLELLGEISDRSHA